MSDGHTEVGWAMLRQKVRKRICEWKNQEWVGHSDATDDMCQLFNAKSYNELQMRRDPELRAQLKALLGSNGYTLWKAMMARLDV